MSGITEDAFINASKTLDCDVATIKAFAKVESRGSGFLPSGEPVILFERHIFRRLLREKGIVITNKPDLINATPGGYKGGVHEHKRLVEAVSIDRECALQSCSWGVFQVMGFHWKTLGYQSLQAFINAAYRSENDHLDMFVRFIKANPMLHRALLRKDWATAARLYNGPAYAKNQYDIKLAKAYDEFSRIV